MVKYIVCDTEGSGLFDYKRPADAEGQPRLAELVLIFVDEDMNIEREYQAYIKPDGWIMPDDTAKIHGLTQDILMEKGIPVVEAIAVYNEAVAEGRVMVAHNSQHDAKQIRAELRRAGMPDQFESAPNICTMRALTDVCKIPPNGGRGGYKWPKLSEAAVFFHFDEFGDHSAMNDARVCLKLLRKLKELDALPEAKVHLAKNPPKKEPIASTDD